MVIKPNFSSFRISGQGMSIQKRKMDVVSENIANTSTTRTEDGTPYKRKFISVELEHDKLLSEGNSNKLSAGYLRSTDKRHFVINNSKKISEAEQENYKVKENFDNSEGELVYMPDHPDSDENGYVRMPNVNIVTEMVDMISASRSFEANLTAFKAAKQIAKESLEI